MTDNDSVNYHLPEKPLKFSLPRSYLCIAAVSGNRDRQVAKGDSADTERRSLTPDRAPVVHEKPPAQPTNSPKQPTPNSAKPRQGK